MFLTKMSFDSSYHCKRAKEGVGEITAPSHFSQLIKVLAEGNKRIF